ncbi:Trans-resveratrol di-O-methyltransferase [Spatholobus suberectus]|nr:Trans-resveratrol di-O-methyltransferase [Spatholobus suberectus]
MSSDGGFDNSCPVTGTIDAIFATICLNLKVLGELVLHILNDEECIKVLKKCREAISNKGKEGKVIIIDIVIGEKNENHEWTETKLFFYMLMMAQVNGREREEKEWEKLFLEAGFKHYKITPIFGLRSLIEVYP